MADLIKTVEIEEKENWSESSEDEEGFGIQNSGFFSGITGSFNKQKQTVSNDQINSETTKKVLGQTKQETNVRQTSTNEKVDRLKNKKKNRKQHKLSQDQNEEDDDEEDQVDEEEVKKMLNQEEEKEEGDKKEKQATWESLRLGKPLIKAVDDLDYAYPTKIQEICIPAVVSGQDVLASSLTGSGKTAAFLVPIIQKLYRSQAENYSKALIILPTRELAFQCYEMFQNLNKYTRLRASLIIGAASMQKQEAELRRHPELIIATPGRLLDHITNSQSIDLDNLEILVFDEADKLLDLGFTAEVTQIAKESNQDRQTLLFSATLNSDVNRLVGISMNKPIKLHANPDSSTSDRLKQFVLKLQKHDQREAALINLCNRFYKDQTLIFFRTKKQCHRMAIIFGLLNMKVCELHGNLSQEQRIQAFEDYKAGKFDYLMATDLAARGLDIKELKAVINFELPQEVSRYIHRAGRTARAGKKGVCVTMCVEQDVLKLKKLMKKDRNKLEKVFLEEKSIRTYQQKIEGLQEDIERILKQESGERQLRKAEMEITRGENMLKHKDDIMNRPKKTWFQSNRDKNDNKRKAKEALDSQDFGDDPDNFYSKNIKNSDNNSKKQNNNNKKFNKNNNNNNKKSNLKKVKK